MKKIAMLFLIAALTACSKVPAGNVGVKVYLLGGEKGVDTEELGPGRYWIGWNEELYLFPTFTQNYVWTADETEGSETDESISFQTDQGLVVNADIGISYSVDPAAVNIVFQKYRRGIEEITDVYLRNMTRDAFVTAASTLQIESVYGSGKEDLIKDVENRVKEQVKPLGINIERIYYVGSLRLPEAVTASIDAKIKATQQAQQRRNEVAESEAAADKRIAEARGEAESILAVAKAQAEANQIIAQSLTPELVQYKSVEKWDGVLPRLTGNGAVPFINVDER